MAATKPRAAAKSVTNPAAKKRTAPKGRAQPATKPRANGRTKTVPTGALSRFARLRKWIIPKRHLGTLALAALGLAVMLVAALVAISIATSDEASSAEDLPPPSPLDARASTLDALTVQRLATSCQLYGELTGAHGAALDLPANESVFALARLEAELPDDDSIPLGQAFAHLSAEVRREALDAKPLAAAANRALSHPDACADPVLAGMLRAFVADQEVLLESTIGRKKAEPAPISYLRHAFEKNKRAITPLPTRAELRDRFQRLAAALEKQYAQYDEEAARSGLERMRELQRSYPVHIGPERLAAAEKMYANLVKRRAGFLKLIDALVEKACGAARAEDHKTAAWLTRRIWAIHALFPILLPEEAARVHRDRIARISEEHEQRESARDLRLREHAVAVEIKKLAAIIHHFHEVTEGMKPDDPEYSAAEQSYRAAVQAVRSHDNEWLTGLMLELETLLEEVHDASGRAEAHVERFLTSVRSALVHMRQEIHAIHAERPDRSRPGK